MTVLRDLSCVLVGVIVVGATATGCATSNYDFAALADDERRGAQLAADLERLGDDDDAREDELHDVRVVPLVHSRLHVFAEADEDDEAAFVEFDVDSFLPLFFIVDGSIDRYDADHRRLSRHEYQSGLWGAFRTLRHVEYAPEGRRERIRHTFLWIFSWWGEERWVPAATARR